MGSRKLQSPWEGGLQLSFLLTQATALLKNLKPYFVRGGTLFSAAKPLAGREATSLVALR